ncbi:FAD binding domain-containing protein [Rhodococcus pyridinivorans]|uniref:FAD binding domain-containing protein n=1 Tax=Rhodococcus pyridinivorans TaxID=103816 RepID=UPI0020C71B79|nr:FAD binding domain-containing protein [Rhodococcus pyridinivorans]UTM38033.1 FAD binding domain-containing protein [Rhodococcus pyridinivorans]
MKPAAFTYHRASSVRRAVELLSELGDDAKLIAGGQSLVAMMNFRLARPEHLIDITHLPELVGIRRVGDALHIGALTTHRAVEVANLGPDFAVLSRTMKWVGHLPIRTRGTIGGSLAHADATAEWCNLAVLLDAFLVVEGPMGTRNIPASKMFQGPFMTALDAGEVIVEIVFPRPAPRAALTEYADRQGDFAIVSAAVDLGSDTRDQGVPTVVLGGIAPTPVLVTAGTDFNTTVAPLDFGEFAEAVADQAKIRDEAGISARYRRGLVRTLVERACKEAAAA